MYLGKHNLQTFITLYSQVDVRLYLNVIMSHCLLCADVDTLCKSEWNNNQDPGDILLNTSYIYHMKDGDILRYLKVWTKSGNRQMTAILVIYSMNRLFSTKLAFDFYGASGDRRHLCCGLSQENSRSRYLIYTLHFISI